eukprot:4568688-Pleurochrysis_carterae.AAC.1
MQAVAPPRSRVRVTTAGAFESSSGCGPGPSNVARTSTPRVCTWRALARLARAGASTVRRVRACAACANECRGHGGGRGVRLLGRPTRARVRSTATAPAAACAKL